MKKLLVTVALGAASLGLSACAEGEQNTADQNVALTEGETGDGNATGDGNGSTTAGTTASASFPQGARIVEENGVTYRIDPDGTRVTLGDTDSRIVIENGVRYRVDPDGTRVRINDRGLNIDLPDVDVGVNSKGNLDVDVNDGDRNDNRQ